MTSALEAILQPMHVESDELGYGELQQLGTERIADRDSGPRALMRAVLRDAILCLQGQGPDVPSKDRGRVADEAAHWVRSRDLSYTFSFEAICDVLGLDAAPLRKLLLQATAAASRTRADGERYMTRMLRRARMRGNRQTRVQQPRAPRPSGRRGATPAPRPQALVEAAG